MYAFSASMQLEIGAAGLVLRKIKAEATIPAVAAGVEKEAVQTVSGIGRVDRMSGHKKADIRRWDRNWRSLRKSLIRLLPNRGPW
jgi:hypothetical protein